MKLTKYNILSFFMTFSITVCLGTAVMRRMDYALSQAFAEMAGIIFVLGVLISIWWLLTEGR